MVIIGLIRRSNFPLDPALMRVQRPDVCPLPRFVSPAPIRVSRIGMPDQKVCLKNKARKNQLPSKTQIKSFKKPKSSIPVS